MVRKNCVGKKVMLNEALPRALSPLHCFARNSPPPRSSAWFSFSPWDIVIWQSNMQRSRSAGRSGGQPEKETTGESKVKLPKMIVGGHG